MDCFLSFPFRLYYAIGWGLPVVQTAVWAVVTGMNMNTACWYGYNHTDYYYIAEGPRLAVIAVSIEQFNFFLFTKPLFTCDEVRGRRSTDNIRPWEILEIVAVEA